LTRYCLPPVLMIAYMGKPVADVICKDLEL
jgi:hypothetical protein